MNDLIFKKKRGKKKFNGLINNFKKIRKFKLNMISNTTQKKKKKNFLFWCFFLFFKFKYFYRTIQNGAFF